MALRKFKPVTAGTRWRIGNAYAEITTDAPEKTLLEKITRTGGRNSQGRRAMRYIGGGHKKMYRIIDFKRDKKEVPGTVVSIEYDPNRTSFIALIQYAMEKKDISWLRRVCRLVERFRLVTPLRRKSEMHCR